MYEYDYPPPGEKITGYRFVFEPDGNLILLPVVAPCATFEFGPVAPTGCITNMIYDSTGIITSNPPPDPPHPDTKK